MPKKKGGRKGGDDFDDEFALPDEGADNAAPVRYAVLPVVVVASVTRFLRG